MGAGSAKHLSVCRIIRNRIVKGAYSGKLPSGRILAEELETDPKTIQCAMAQLEIMGLVQRMQRKGIFVTPANERSRPLESGFVSLITEGAGQYGDIWQAPIIVAFQHAAREHQLDVVLRFLDDEGRTLSEALDNAVNRRCAGTCILALPVSAAAIMRLAQSGASVVVADWDLEEVLLPCVVFDNYTAGRQAAEYLIELGHRRIAYISGSQISPDQRDRLQGFQHAAQRAGLELLPPAVDGQTFARAFSASRGEPRAATAVVVWNDIVSEDMLDIFEETGVALPRDLSLITYGGRLTARRGRRITAVAMDHEGMGRTALETLLDERSFREPRKILVSSMVRKGPTTGPPRASG